MGSLGLLFGLTEGDAEGGLWVGHSVFQLPVSVQRYKGQAESLVLCYLYEFASRVSFYSDKPVVIEVKVSQEVIAEKTGLSPWAVSEAVNSLEADDCIRVTATRDKLTGRVRLNVYLLLHSTTQEPLRCSPAIWGVCYQNGERPYITAPKETLKSLTQIQPGARAVYLAALALGSVRKSMSFVVTREEWKLSAVLGKNSFNRGVKECTKRGLLSYKRQKLTLNDPVTCKPSTKTRGVRVQQTDPETRWKFSLDAITAEEWQKVAQHLLGREFTVNASGWSHTTADGLCPFCKEARSFSMNFAQSQWHCHKCNARGRLFQLVQRVLRETQAQRVREYIADLLGPAQSEAPELVAVTADGHAEI